MPPHTLDGILSSMTCPACGQEERQDRKSVLASPWPLTLHRECPRGHAWHLSFGLEPDTGPATWDREA